MVIINPFRFLVASLALSSPVRAFWYPTAVSTPKATPSVAKGLPNFSNATLDPIQNILDAINGAINATLNFQEQFVLGILWVTVEGLAGVATALVPNTSTPIDFGADPPPYQPDYIQYTTANYQLPPGFLLGVATSATQVEGAVKVGNRGPSIIDYLCHNINLLCNGYTSDVTTNSYYKYYEDVARIKYLGLNSYSFSISWTRIYPLGSGALSEDGMAYYDRLIDACIAAGIEPVVTLFHWDSPLALVRQYGFFTDIGTQVITDYVNYATTVFLRYGKKVKKWVTFNEPRIFCYAVGLWPYTESYAPGINSNSAPYRCTYNVLKAHGRAVQTYRQLVGMGYIAPGEITFKSDDNWPIPYSLDPEDARAADRHAAFRIGIFAQPVYGDGNYPAIVNETLGNLLPPLTDDDKALIRGSADTFNIDYYRTDISKAASGGIDACIAKGPSDARWPICEETAPQYSHALATGWSIGQNADPMTVFLVNSGAYLRRQLQWLHSNYPAPNGIFISEFGFAEPFEYNRNQLYQIRWDGARSAFLRDHLNAMLQAIHEDGINLRGAFVWSLMDNFEWQLGEKQKFGISYVDYDDNQKRTFKLSAFVLRDFAQQHLSPIPPTPTSNNDDPLAGLASAINSFLRGLLGGGAPPSPATPTSRRR